MANLVKNGYFNNGKINWINTGGNVFGNNIPPYYLYYLLTVNNNGLAILSQSITFPKEGKYILSFWIQVLLSRTVVVKIGNTVLKSIETTPGIIQITIPFDVNRIQLTQTLSFNENAYSVYTQIMNIMNIFIVPANFDYTLDLFLEWIPDEEEEKHRKNKRLM